jgi:hypothetical protein
VPYFFILPLYVAAFLGLLALTAWLHFTRFKNAAPYVLGATLGSVPGFVGANALLIYGVKLLLTANEHTPAAPSGPLSILAGFATMGALIVVPFVVSAVGIALGAVGGMYAAWRLR